MARKKGQTGGGAPVRCPTCSNVAIFRLVLATISSIPVQQVYPHKWKAERFDPAALNFTVPVCVVCDTCGQPFPATSDIVAAAARSKRRKPD